MPPIYTRGSWYSQLPPFGWFDPEDTPGSAALRKDGKSVPDSEQGIALPSRAGLGKWYDVTPPGGGIPYPMQQTDVGPAKWTGRGVDISAAAAHKMGYTPKDFPTDATWKIEPRDEPRGLGSPAGMPVQAGDLPDNATGGDAYAAAPKGRKMPENDGLLSMFSPRDMGGQPTGFGDMLAQRQNSLIGLGLGLMSGTAQDPYSNAMRGYAQGASSDQDRYQTAQAMAQRKADQARAQANTDRSFNEQVRQFNLAAEGGKVPPGWAKGPDGGLAPIPGGPADPKYLQQVAEGKAKPREFSVTDITKLSEEGGKFAQVRGFTDTFEPRFAGSKMGALGDIRNLAGRNLPESVVGKDVAEGATWWQGYDNFKNVARHELYGGALTPTEVGVFEKANINPAMDPAQIQKNLAIQKEIVANGLKRKANAMIASGYDPKAISQAYGIPLEEIGVTATGRRGTVAPTTAAPTTDKDTGGNASALDKARQAIKSGAPRDAVLKRLRENGIDPAGL